MWSKFDDTWKKSFRIAFEIVAGISTIVGIWGYTLRDISEKITWWQCLIILFVMFLGITAVCKYVFKKIKHKPYETVINGKRVMIKVGDIFSEAGLKVIPFNEFFDTVVDDVIISKRSLNGQMIEHHISDKNQFEQVIKNAQNENSSLGKPVSKAGKMKYPLGRIIKYEEFAMLAFTHFNEQNEAFINIGEYEKCLFNMWKELRRVYASDKIILPLIGSGITTIEGTHTKDNTTLLKCILCTLRGSKFIPDSGVTIVLTSEAMDEIDMNRIREEF